MLMRLMGSHTERLHEQCHSFLRLVKRDYDYLEDFYRERDGILNDEHLDR